MQLNYYLIKHNHGGRLWSQGGPQGLWTWADFIVMLKNQLYSRYHHKMKEQEFLALSQGDISMLECKRRFHDLSMFVPHHVPTK